MTRTAQEVLREIEADMESDATRFDGQPFNGRTVAEYLGNQGAAIAAIAGILRNVLDANKDTLRITIREEPEDAK